MTIMSYPIFFAPKVEWLLNYSICKQAAGDTASLAASSISRLYQIVQCIVSASNNACCFEDVQNPGKMNNNIFTFVDIIIFKYIIYIKEGATPALERTCGHTIAVAMYANYRFTFYF